MASQKLRALVGRSLTLCLALCIVEMGVCSSSDSATFTTFDPPDAIFITPSSINAAGAITGSFHTFKGNHSFLRDPNGTITTFDAPGAGSGSGQGTFVSGIDTEGAIAGYLDSNSISHGFVRAGFVRAPAGKFTRFRALRADGDGTFVSSINMAGAITGIIEFPSLNSPDRSFVRTPNGKITRFHVSRACNDTDAIGINTAGAITGTCFDKTVNKTVPLVARGFVRTPQGAITTFDAPGSDVRLGTRVTDINTAGSIVGFYADHTGLEHGFLRDP